jgi:hypothetical protein
MCCDAEKSAKFKNLIFMPTRASHFLQVYKVLRSSKPVTAHKAGARGLSTRMLEI